MISRIGAGTGAGPPRSAASPNLPAQIRQYLVAWLYLAAFVVMLIVDNLILSSHDHAALLRWASTNVVNLRHDPAGSMVVSAFLPSSYPAAWPALIALCLFGANRALGNWRTAVVCAAGHVIGTLVSEGIVDYRVGYGQLPAAATRILDVGPSYVVMAAIAVAVLYGSWPARVAAAVDFAILVFTSAIFAGLTSLDVDAVGHATALVVAVLLGSALMWQRRRASQAAAGSWGTPSP